MENLDYCVHALRGALTLSKQSIQVEIAVCFVLFYKHNGSINIETMRALRQVYADAGRVDCLTPDSRSYKTVSRRSHRCADFYETIGHRTIKKVLKDKYGQAAIDAIVAYIEPFEIDSMDDVAAHSGKPRKKAVEQPGEELEPIRNRRAVDAPEVIHVRTRHIDVPIPPAVPKKELLDLAKKLMALAEKM